MPRLHLLISGRVQGVGFREWTVRTARGLDLAGWVRNRVGGEVEIEAEGDAVAVEAFRAACHSGPRFAMVAIVEDLPGSGDMLSHPFERRGTA